MKIRSNRWDDHYTRKAREENWLARSVYKLKEIDSKFRILRKGDRVLDLGCYPGSWSQYALKKVGPSGTVIGLDLVAPEGFFYPNFRFLGLDVFDVEPISLKEELGEVDVVLSDLAPSTTGVKNTDSARSMNLAAKAFEIAEAVLRGQGYFVCKVFEGEDMSRFRSLVSSRFGGARLLRPAATRKRSREVYLIGLGAVRSKVLPGNGECHPAGEPEQP